MAPRRAPRVVLALLVPLLLAASGAVLAQDDATAPAGADNETAPADGAAANGTGPADGADGGGAVDYAIDVLPVEAGGRFDFTPNQMAFPAGARVQLTYDHATAQAPHNLNVYEGLPEPVATRCCLTGEGGREAVRFTMPASGELRFRCDVHPEMQGVITVGTFSIGSPDAGGGAAGGHTGVPALGVHFLAYWVGVIAFAVLFIVYGLTFFLFKYGESGATTDHMDRPGAAVGSGGENRARSWFLIGITLAVVVGGALIAAANMPKGG